MEHMTRDEFLYQQIKGNRSLYRGLAFVYGAAAVAAFIMAIAALVIGRPDGSIILLFMGGGMVVSASASWSERKTYADALDEIGPNPVGVDTRRTYSQRTAKAIAASRMSAKEFLQQWIAYGILALTMIGMGTFLVAIMIEMEETVYALLGAGLAGGGSVLLFMSIKAFRNWRVAKYFESFL